jgi:hypothetical protein
MEWNGIWVYGGLINMLLWLYGESLFWGGGGGSGGWKIINREGGGAHTLQDHPISLLMGIR